MRSASTCCRTARRSASAASGSSSSLAGVAAVVGRCSSSALVHGYSSRADRQPASARNVATSKTRDRQARRADRGDRQAARGDRGAARAQAGRRDAAGQPHRGRAPARPAGAPAARRRLPQVDQAERHEGQRRRLRAVERARLDADAQHRGLAVAREAGAGRDQGGPRPRDKRQRRQRIHHVHARLKRAHGRATPARRRAPAPRPAPKREPWRQCNASSTSSSRLNSGRIRATGRCCPRSWCCSRIFVGHRRSAALLRLDRTSSRTARAGPQQEEAKLKEQYPTRRRPGGQPRPLRAAAARRSSSRSARC